MRICTIITHQTSVFVKLQLAALPPDDEPAHSVVMTSVSCLHTDTEKQTDDYFIL